MLSIKIAEAQSLWDKIKNRLQSLSIWDFIFGGPIGVAYKLITGENLAISIISWIFQGFHYLLVWINNSLIAPLIDIFSQLDPFKNNVTYIDPKGRPINAPSPIGIIWNILRNFAYIILIFSALSAGFEWLMGQDASAKKLIFNIIIVALMINFTFVLIEEAFKTVKSIEDGLTGGASGQVGTMMAASLWQRDPFEQIAKISQQMVGAGWGGIPKALAEILGYAFIIGLDMIIFTVLLVTLVLFLVRYLMIIFLAGVSPIAVASLTFPEFKGIAGLSQVFSTTKVFDNWFGYLINWLLVVPIFVILVVLGNILTNNTLGQITATSSPENRFFEFIIVLIILTGWYSISLIVARKLSKGISEWAEKLAKTILAGTGLLIGAGLTALAGPAVGSVLSKAGNFMVSKVPVSPWTVWMAKPGMWAKRAGEELAKKRSEPMAEVAGSRMKLYREQLEKAKDDQERAEAIKNMVSLIQGRYVKGNRYALEKVVNEMDKIPAKDFEKIATNKDAISTLLNSDLPDEAVEKIRKKITGLSDKTKLQILTDENLLPIYQNAAKIQADFLEEIGKIEGSKMIEALSKAKPEAMSAIMKMAKQNPELQRTLDKATKGFYSALVKGEAKAVANAISKLGEDVLINFSQLEAMKDKVNPNLNLLDVVAELVQTETEMVLKAANKSTDHALRKALEQRFGDSERFISELGLRPGTKEYRLANQVLRQPKPTQSNPQQSEQLELPFDQQQLELPF